jgi:hypothetical protein
VVQAKGARVTRLPLNGGKGPVQLGSAMDDTFTTRFERELSGVDGYDFDINSCEIAGPRLVQGTTGNTGDTPPR